MQLKAFRQLPFVPRTLQTESSQGNCFPITVTEKRIFETCRSYLRAAKRGGFQKGGFPDLDLSFLFCPFLSFLDFSGIFPICSGMVQGFSRFVLFLFLGLLSAPTRNSPERVCDTIWTFPEKSGKHPGLETTRFSFSQITVTEKTDFSKYFL